MNRLVPDFEPYIRQGQQQSANVIKGGLLLLEAEPGRGRARFALRQVTPAEATVQVLGFLVMVLTVSARMLNLEVMERGRNSEETHERGYR